MARRFGVIESFKIRVPAPVGNVMEYTDDLNETDLSEYAAWLADLTSADVAGGELRRLLAERIAKPGLVEQAAREVEIAQRVRRLMIKLQELEMEISPDFEAKLMARVSEDVALLSLLEVYLTGFGRSVIELINAFFSFFPEPAPREPSPV